MYTIAQVLLGSYVIYLFLGMQMIVLNIVYGLVLIALCIHNICDILSKNFDFENLKCNKLFICNPYCTQNDNIYVETMFNSRYCIVQYFDGGNFDAYWLFKYLTEIFWRPLWAYGCKLNILCVYMLHSSTGAGISVASVPVMQALWCKIYRIRQSLIYLYNVCAEHYECFDEFKTNCTSSSSLCTQLVKACCFLSWISLSLLYR